VSETFTALVLVGRREAPPPGEEGRGGRGPSLDWEGAVGGGGGVGGPGWPGVIHISPRWNIGLDRGQLSCTVLLGENMGLYCNCVSLCRFANFYFSSFTDSIIFRAKFLYNE
jgi:hypothetical protein